MFQRTNCRFSILTGLIKDLNFPWDDFLKAKYSREEIFEQIDSKSISWKESLFYDLYPLITKEPIFSKLPYLLAIRKKIGPFDSILYYLRNSFLLPSLFIWSLIVSPFESLYYRVKYPYMSRLKYLKNETFDYLFVLNTKDHIITALPVIENMDQSKKCLIITFRDVYSKYFYEFNKLQNSKVIFFDYELKNIPSKKYLQIISESIIKYNILKSCNLGKWCSQLIFHDRHFIKYHLKTELVQYNLFKKIYQMFSLKGSISIVFTTAFEVSKEENIPTFVLQHGIGARGHGHPFVSDYWFTFDDISKEQLNVWLDNTVTIYPSGLPRFDFLKHNLAFKKDIGEFNKKIGVKGYKQTVTYIGGALEGHLTFEALKALREKLPEYVNLIIKEHPRVPLSILNFKNEMGKRLANSDLNHITFIRNEIDFYDILSNSDVVISRESTGMLEAIAVGIPVIQINFLPQSIAPSSDLSSYGWKEPINDSDNLIKETTLLINDNSHYKYVIQQQKTLQKNIFKNFGRTGEVIAKCIRDLCESNN